MNKKNRPSIQLSSFVLDAKDIKQLAEFYEKLLGWRRLQGSEEYEGIANPEGTFFMYFQYEPEYVPPVWPTHPGCQQIMTHLDFAVNDLEAAVEYALSLGATLAKEQYYPTVKVCLDPAGHPFCLFKHE